MTDWRPEARIRVLTILFLIALLFSSFLTFDWTQHYFGIVRLSDPEWMYTRITKTLTSFLIFILAVTPGNDGLNEKDTKKLRLCFILIFSGDMLFLLDELSLFFDNIAIIMFLMGHIAIILRNGQGFRKHIQSVRGWGKMLREIAIGACMAAGTAVIFRFTLYGSLAGKPLLYILIVYSVVLVASLWTGWASLRIGHFPKANAAMIAAGATCFFIGDYIVGFNLSLGAVPERATTLFLTWVFYTPAILLFALSGYRWGNRQTVSG